MNDPSLNRPPELFAERPVRSDFARAEFARRRRGPPYVVRRFITIFVLCTLIGTGIYFAVGRKSTPSVPGEIPTVKSEGSYKQRPEQPGGIDIPHQDVQVYQALDGKGDKAPAVERLLPPPEQPQAANLVAPSARPPAKETPKQIESLMAAPDAQLIASKPAEAQPAPQPEVTPASIDAAPKTAAPPTTALQQMDNTAVAPPPEKQKTETLDAVFQKVTAQESNAKAEEPAPINTVEKKSSVPLGKGVMVQLASLPDKNTAQSNLARLQKQYEAVLGGSSLRLVKADLGAKGIYYRIQSESMSENRAKDICETIKARKGGCILVR